MMNRVEMNEDMMAQVNGGKTEIIYRNAKIHDNCGGMITSGPHGYICKKCHEENHRAEGLGYHIVDKYSEYIR